MSGFCDHGCSCWAPCGVADQTESDRMPWWDKRMDDYQYCGKLWRCSPDGAWDAINNTYPDFIIEAGRMVEDLSRSRSWDDPPEYMERPVETIIVRPIVKWAGRVSR